MSPAAKKAKKRLSEAELTARLAAKHPPGPWAFLPQVRNGTGYSRKVRTADALAMSLWPSRGLELHGFEIKSRRGDWLAELKEPEKAEEIARFCHRWWIVANEDVVELSELPPAWGLMVPHTRGLGVSKSAEKQEAENPTYPFFAALLRKVTEIMVPLASIQAQLEERFKAGQEAQRSTHRYRCQDHERLQNAVKEFEEASGLKIPLYGGGRELGALVKLVENTGASRIRTKLRGDRNTLRRLLEDFDAALEEIEVGTEVADE
jgi:hypothetical protein